MRLFVAERILGILENQISDMVKIKKETTRDMIFLFFFIFFRYILELVARNRFLSSNSNYFSASVE